MYYYKGEYDKAGEKLNRLAAKPKFIHLGRAKKYLDDIKAKQRAPERK
jgi:hypothetical protein